ncbi:MAG: hypothetical protein NZ874_09645 [Fimbriimonadales bacterium]|nr:hypothetical protein [Fimbriimonadales bacterium]
MRRTHIAVAALWSLIGVSVAYSQAFTYQGFLRVNGAPQTGTFNMRFTLFSVPNGGTPLGNGPIALSVPVTSGLFTVSLNFGPLTLWGGAPRWLQIEVADPPNSTNYVPLNPRVEIRPTPYSFFAYSAPWSGLIGVPAGFADGIDNDTTYSAGAGLQLSGTTFSIAPNGVVTSMIANNSVTNDKIVSVDWSKITNAPAFLTSVSAQSPLAGDGTAANPLRLINGTANEQIIKWTGSSWALQPDGLVLPYSRYYVSNAPQNSFIVYHNNTSNLPDNRHNAVVGVTYGNAGRGVEGLHFGVNATGSICGVLGQNEAKEGYGIFGLARNTALDATALGAFGASAGGRGTGVYAIYSAPDDPNLQGAAIRVWVVNAAGRPNVYGIVGNGNFSMSGTKAFQIDHPLYPETHYLNHFCAEGPDPYNIYSGVVVLDANGEAWVELPDYYEAINRDPRYHLTPIGAAMPNLHIAEEVQGNRFKIAGGVPGKKVSWEVKAIRNDRWIQQFGYRTVAEKPDNLKGKFVMPQLYGRDPVLDSVFSICLPKDVLADPARRNRPDFGIGSALADALRESLR